MKNQDKWFFVFKTTMVICNIYQKCFLYITCYENIKMNQEEQEENNALNGMEL